MVAAYAAGMAALSLARHRAYATGRFDLGNMVQAVWNTAHGRILESTEVSGAQFSRLGAHVDPALALFAPLALVWPGADPLLIAQAAIVATGALPAFWLGRRFLGDERLALAAAAAWLLYPPLQFAVLFDFHPVTLAAPLLLFAIWAAAEGRVPLLALFGLLAIATQEQVGLAVAGIALWMAWRHPARRRAGASIAAAAVAWVAVAVAVVIPHFAVEGGNPHVRRYGALGDGPSDILTTALTRPWELAQVALTPGRLGYLALLLLPVLFLPLLAPALLAGALPQVAINLLADTGPAQSIEYHYAAVIAPFVIASAILGLARLRESPRRARLPRRALAPGALAAALVAGGLLVGARVGPLPLWSGVPLGWDGSPHMTFTPDAQARALARAVALVPPDARVSASNAPGAHLSARRRVHLFPVVRDADYVVIARGGRVARATRGRKTLRMPQHAVSARLIDRDPSWQLLLDEAGVRVYRRLPTTARAAERGRG